MHSYLIMRNPGHSRVYYDQSAKLACAELTIACSRFTNKVTDIKIESIADLHYISFKMEQAINNDELSIISRLSFIFALFEIVEYNERKLLSPITLNSKNYIDQKISNLLKYAGKTNELFTKMMINIALLSSKFHYDQHIKLLDPVAGKGTTLFEGAVYGYDVAGIEINKKSVHESALFFKKFLEEEKFKHTQNKVKGTRKGKTDSTDTFEFEYSATKEEFKDFTSRKRLKMVVGDSSNANRYVKKNSVHLIVGDLPYGIAHNNIGKSKRHTASRNPSEMLTECLPEWYKILMKNGVIVLSWNKFVLPRQKMVELFETFNYRVFSDNPYDHFEHRVDMSIKRDVIVAQK